MKFKVLIISIFAALTALLQFSENRHDPNNLDFNTHKHETAYEICSFTSPESELNLPRPTGITNIPRCQSFAKRTINSGTSTLYSFSKSGKFLTVLSKGLSYICPDLLYSGQYSVSEYIICIRKLII